EFLKTENNSIWMGKVKVLKLGSYAVQILPKLKLRDGNELEELVLGGWLPEHIPKILGMKNNNIWVGKMKKPKLTGYATKILPKLRFHRENELEELSLTAYCSEHIAGMLEMENKNIRIGKVRKISLKGCYAEKIRSKLDFTLMDSREENGGA
ncbi:MAG: uncharacterized protein A8A55_2179, partial [Amphiamblys sp. WSBS2006]